MLKTNAIPESKFAEGWVIKYETKLKIKGPHCPQNYNLHVDQKQVTQILPSGRVFRQRLKILSSIQSNNAVFSFVNTGRQVHLQHARWHFERNLVKDVHHRSVESRNWLKSQRQGEADLTPADFFLWGPLKGKVYKYTPRTIEQLKILADRFIYSMPDGISNGIW